ncbi:MAG: hypothetical protein QXT39_04815 [Conexivisphaerales archaeon]
MAYMGRYARTSLIREFTWELLREDEEWATKPFTVKDFLVKYGQRFGEFLEKIRPNSNLESVAKGALRSLEKKGLLLATRNFADITFSKNIYYVHKSLAPYSYGRALIEAQRLHFL